MRKVSFTLFEMLIVMFLIALCLGGGVFGVFHALNKESFEKDAKAVLGQLAYAEELMINTKRDVRIEFVDQKCLVISPKKSRTIKLSKITEVQFNGRTDHLTYDGTLGVPPRGILMLRGKEHQKEISLPGIPGQLNQKEIAVHEASYPQEILSLT